MRRHALTIDLESWYHAENMRPVAPATEWPRLPSRLRQPAAALLELLAERATRATFFVLGDAAAREPELIREIAAAGHEIACHGWSHELIYRQTPAAFAEETHRAKALLEDLSGRPVEGYRASTFSITGRSLWALDLLAAEGFRYDSSIAPVRHDRYGIPGAPRTPHWRTVDGGRRIAEFPISFGRLLGLRLPVGGGFFRLLPLSWTQRALGLYEGRGEPAGIYLHPWEFDPEQPRPAGLPALRRFRHYVGLGSAMGKLRSLLERVPFTAMVDVLGDFLAGFEPRRSEAKA